MVAVGHAFFKNKNTLKIRGPGLATIAQVIGFHFQILKHKRGLGLETMILAGWEACGEDFSVARLCNAHSLVKERNFI